MPAATARGDKPHHAAAYRKDLQAADVVAVLRAMQVPRADYFGYSLGGRVGLALAEFAPERIRGLIIGGAAGDGRSRIGDGILGALKKGGLEAMSSLFDIAPPPGLKARVLANDVAAMMAHRCDNLGFSEALSAMTMPCLLFAGTADPICRLAEETCAEMPNATFFAVYPASAISRHACAANWSCPGSRNFSVP